jgi:tRNA-uridine 2-sulfurtransferase
VDENKDQSYFLWALPPEMLPQLLFPLGELTKPQVRQKARELGLATAEKPESMEICFVPSGNYVDFLERKLEPGHPALSAGDLVTADGEVIGRHDGYARYTVGQRKGLPGGRSLPLYVLGSRPDTREVVVGTAEELHRERRAHRRAELARAPPAAGDRVRVQLRSRARAVDASWMRWTRWNPSRARRAAACRDARPVRRAVPRDVVLGAADVVLGGGRIDA